MTLFSPDQSQEAEWMDGDGYSFEDLKASLEGIQWVNRYLGGYSIILKNVQALSRDHQQKNLSILDIATGSADIPIEIARWARKMRLEISILAIDKNPNIVKIAQENAADYPEIRVEVHDFFKFPYNDNSFDYCLSSLFLHHLRPVDVIPFLRIMHRLCRQAAFVNDLIRGWIPFYSYKALASLFRLHPMTRHDGAISVLRAFTIPELERIIKPAFSSYEVKKYFPYRFGLTIRKGESHE